MNTWNEYIEKLKYEWIGERVVFEGAVYTIVDVDYNGVLMINKKGKYTETTAAFTPEHAVIATENGRLTASDEDILEISKRLIAQNRKAYEMLAK